MEYKSQCTGMSRFHMIWPWPQSVCDSNYRTWLYRPEILPAVNLWVTLHCFTVDWFCECFKEMPYMMEWKHILVISFFGVRGGGGGSKGREVGGNSVFTFFSIYSKSLRKCTEKFWKSWKKFYINEIKLKEIWPPPSNTTVLLPAQFVVR